MAGSSGFINVVIVGDDAGVQAMLLRMNTAVSPVNLGIFLNSMVDPYLRERARQRFASEGDDVSGGWAPLAPFTQKDRADRGYGAAHPINRRTGRLENYVTDTPGRVTTHTAGANLTTPGTAPNKQERDKLEIAQKGRSSYPFVPARPVIGVNERDLLVVMTGLAHHIRGMP